MRGAQAGGLEVGGDGAVPSPASAGSQQEPLSGSPDLARTRHLPPRAPCDSHGSAKIRDALGRLATLHGELARTYENLAEDAAKELADRGKAAVTEGHTMSTSPPAPQPAFGPRTSVLISQKHLAEFLQCHPRTVRRMELKGTLPAALGEGRLKRWRRTDIQDWIQGSSSRRRRGVR